MKQISGQNVSVASPKPLLLLHAMPFPPAPFRWLSPSSAIYMKEAARTTADYPHEGWSVLRKCDWCVLPYLFFQIKLWSLTHQCIPKALSVKKAIECLLAKLYLTSIKGTVLHFERNLLLSLKLFVRAGGNKPRLFPFFLAMEFFF